MIINGGLDSKSFCVTGNNETAMAFIRASSKGGVLHLVNQQTADLCRMLDRFNVEADPDKKWDLHNPLRQGLEKILKSFFPHGDFDTYLEIPHEKFEWDKDGPHAHGHLVALLVGNDTRPTEISTNPLLKNLRTDSKENLHKRNIQWGRAGSEQDRDYFLHAPFSFLQRGLTTLIPSRTERNASERNGPMHSIPRQLQPHETRGHVLVSRWHF